MKSVIAGLIAIFAAVLIFANVRANYEYANTIGSYWDLSDKSSTLQQKSTYLDKYVEALQQPGKFAPHDATVYPTPNNSFDQNMVALLSLQGRMHQIQGMDEQSFAYQTAISQITAQEQGEAQALTATFEGCWFLENHYFLWDWHQLLIWMTLIVTAVVVGFLALTE